VAKTLVVYYSRTGNTRQIGQELASALGADAEELRDGQDRRSPMGYLKSGLEARRHSPARLQPLVHDPATYDLLVVGTPIWVSTVSTPVRTFLERYVTPEQKVAWFCTYGLEGEKYPERAFQAMTQAAGLTPLATLSVRTQDVAGKHREAVAEYAARLSRRLEAGRQKG